MNYKMMDLLTTLGYIIMIGIIIFTVVTNQYIYIVYGLVIVIVLRTIGLLIDKSKEKKQD